jgi:hypothetical protein
MFHPTVTMIERRKRVGTHAVRPSVLLQDSHLGSSVVADSRVLKSVGWLPAQAKSQMQAASSRWYAEFTSHRESRMTESVVFQVHISYRAHRDHSNTEVRACTFLFPPSFMYHLFPVLRDRGHIHNHSLRSQRYKA